LSNLLFPLETEDPVSANPSYDPFDFHASRNTNKPVEKTPTHKTSTVKTPTTEKTTIPETSRTTPVIPTEPPQILTTQQTLVEKPGKLHPLSMLHTVQFCMHAI
jgi:hypothetical protein